MLPAIRLHFISRTNEVKIGLAKIAVGLVTTPLAPGPGKSMELLQVSLYSLRNPIGPARNAPKLSALSTETPNISCFSSFNSSIDGHHPFYPT